MMVKIDNLAARLAVDVLVLLMRLYPDARNASRHELDAACAAIRAKSRSVIDKLIDDAKGAPWVATEAYKAAALTLAHEGVKALKAESGRD